MPTYEYKCKKCNEVYEFFQNMTDEKKTMCPDCKTNSLKKMIGRGAGIIFKGSGFYETDYKAKEKKQQEQKPKTEKEGKSNKTKTENSQNNNKKPAGEAV